MIPATLCVSLLEIWLADKRIIRADKRVIRAGEGQDF